MKTAANIKQDLDLDLFVDALAADRDHIDRAKAKAQAVQDAAKRSELDRQRRAQEAARITRRMELTASLTVLAAGLWTFLAAWLA